MKTSIKTLSIVISFCFLAGCGDNKLEFSDKKDTAEEDTVGKTTPSEVVSDSLPSEAVKCRSDDTFTLFWSTRASYGLDFENQEQLNDVFRAAEEPEFYFLSTDVNPGMPVFKNRTTITALKGDKKAVEMKVVRVEKFACENGSFAVTYEAKTQPQLKGKYLTIEDFRDLFRKLLESRNGAKLRDTPPVRPGKNALQIQMQELPEESESLIQG